MFEGPVTGNIPEVLDNGEVTDGTRHSRTAGPRSDALRASNGPGGKHCGVRQQRGCHPVPGRPGHRRAGLKAAFLATAAALARKQHRRAAELADHGSLQQGRPVGLRRAGGRGGHQERGPEAVQLQHHGGHERLHRLGQQRRQLRPQDGGGPALPRHSGEDHAAGGGHQGGHRRSAGLASRDASISGLQASKAD